MRVCHPQREKLLGLIASSAMASNPAAGLDFDLDRLMNVLERKQSDRMASQRVDDAVRTAAQAKATESVSESISAATSSAARAGTFVFIIRAPSQIRISGRSC